MNNIITYWPIFKKLISSKTNISVIIMYIVIVIYPYLMKNGYITTDNITDIKIMLNGRQIFWRVVDFSDLFSNLLMGIGSLGAFGGIYGRFVATGPIKDLLPKKQSTVEEKKDEKVS